jgi:hypothetical protein
MSAHAPLLLRGLVLLSPLADTRGMNTNSIRRLTDLIDVCARDLDYATSIGDATRAAEATADMARFSDELSIAVRALAVEVAS